jgi:hypothetical protein
VSEISFKGKAPTPQVHDNRSLQVRQGSPAYSHAAPSNSKTEIAPVARQHVMGAKGAVQAPKPNAAGNAPARAGGVNVLKHKQTPAGLKNTAGASRAGNPGSVSAASKPAAPASTPTSSSASTPPDAHAQLALALLSPPAALLLGQLLEMFIAGEQMGPNRNSIYVQIGSKALADLAPFLPAGVVIPIPDIPESMVIPSPIHAPEAPAPVITTTTTTQTTSPAPAPAAAAPASTTLPASSPPAAPSATPPHSTK